jgi:23S rRNA pseudouridine2605 synthase
MAAERLQKLLAHAGVASRRAAEKMITEGRVRVNGRIVTELGAKADGRTGKIEVDGRRIVLERPVYYVVHKPRDVVTTLNDPEERPHLGKLLKGVEARVYPVGRLDYHTSGAVLVTNDGDLAAALLRPNVPRIYAAKLRGHLDVPELDKIRRGVRLEDGETTEACECFVIREEENATWIQLTLHGSKPKQIDRMALAIGHPLQRLVRTEFAGIATEGLRPGEYRELTQKEIDKLRKTYLRHPPNKRASRHEEEA